jgi:hypothetical protein
MIHNGEGIPATQNNLCLQGTANHQLHFEVAGFRDDGGLGQINILGDQQQRHHIILHAKLVNVL